jgi:hypothetical protein
MHDPSEEYLKVTNNCSDSIRAFQAILAGVADKGIKYAQQRPSDEDIRIKAENMIEDIANQDVPYKVVPHIVRNVIDDAVKINKEVIHTEYTGPDLAGDVPYLVQDLHEVADSMKQIAAETMREKRIGDPATRAEVLETESVLDAHPTGQEARGWLERALNNRNRGDEGPQR